MEHQSQHIHSCAHCSGSGTCKHGVNDASCAACAVKNELKKGEYFGLACGTCGGLGKTDTVTYRMNNRTTPLLAIMIVACCFALICVGILRDQHFQEILTFSGTVIGSVIGYYFGGKFENRTH